MTPNNGLVYFFTVISSPIPKEIDLIAEKLYLKPIPMDNFWLFMPILWVEFRGTYAGWKIHFSKYYNNNDVVVLVCTWLYVALTDGEPDVHCK